MCYQWFLRSPDVPFPSERRRRHPQPRVAGPTGESPSLSVQTVDQGRSRIERVFVLTRACYMWLCLRHKS
ncbi:hypothetical protein Hanom_Chr14g01306271 [Helianthus anomalus]